MAMVRYGSVLAALRKVPLTTYGMTVERTERMLRYASQGSRRFGPLDRASLVKQDAQTGIPFLYSEDPTQWIFDGQPCAPLRLKDN